VPLADFGTRLLAWLIDTAVLTAVLTAVTIPVFFVLISSLVPDTIDTNSPNPDIAPIFTSFFLPFFLFEAGIVVVALGAYYLYAVELMHRTGQTLGKKAMKIRIVPLDPAAKLTRGMAAKRYLVEYLGAMLVPFLSYLDGFWQLWDKPYQQTLHDKFAQTIVVKVLP
jgi:uncharacterized RDD family membrane protein YckC